MDYDLVQEEVDTLEVTQIIQLDDIDLFTHEVPVLYYWYLI